MKVRILQLFLATCCSGEGSKQRGCRPLPFPFTNVNLLSDMLKFNINYSLKHRLDLPNSVFCVPLCPQSHLTRFFGVPKLNSFMALVFIEDIEVLLLIVLLTLRHWFARRCSSICTMTALTKVLRPLASLVRVEGDSPVYYETVNS